VKQIHDQVERGEEVEGMYLTYLLSSDKLSLGEVYISLTELLLGGVDTVRICLFGTSQTGSRLNNMICYKSSHFQTRIYYSEVNCFRVPLVQLLRECFLSTCRKNKRDI